MAPKKIQTVCGYSCSDCEHHTRECPGCTKMKGRPFWTSYVGIDQCAIFQCCMTERKLPHCGKCPDLLCERFTRYRQPGMSDEQVATGLAAMEKELRARK